MRDIVDTVRDDVCQSCGACCAHSRDWPRFTIEDDATLAEIPIAYINTDETGMRCRGERCTALIGDVGVATSCAIYDVRPEVCRACIAGDEACTIARAAAGLPALAC